MRWRVVPRTGLRDTGSLKSFYSAINGTVSVSSFGMTMLRYCSPASTWSPLLEDLSETGDRGDLGESDWFCMRGVNVAWRSASPITELHRFSAV